MSANNNEDQTVKIEEGCLGDTIDIVDDASGSIEKLSLEGESVQDTLDSLKRLDASIENVPHISIFVIPSGPFNESTVDGLDQDSLANLVKRHVVPQKNWSSIVLTEIMDAVPSRHTIDTTTLCESPERIYQMIYITDYKDDAEKQSARNPNNRNYLAEWLTWDRKEIYGMTVIVTAAVSHEGRVSDCTDAPGSKMVEMADILTLLKRRECFTTVLVSASPENANLPYKEQEMHSSTLATIRQGANVEGSDVVVHERIILGDRGFHLVAWGGVDTSQPVNKIATRILAKRVYGNWNFALEVWYGSYYDLTEEQLEVISNICEGPRTEPDVTEDDVKPDERVVSRYVLLRNRIYRIRRGCHRCGKLSASIKRCSGCYRLRYCSQACQTADWGKHQLDCCIIDEEPSSEKTHAQESSSTHESSSATVNNCEHATAIAQLD